MTHVPSESVMSDWSVSSDVSSSSDVLEVDVSAAMLSLRRIAFGRGVTMGEGSKPEEVIEEVVVRYIWPGTFILDT